MQSAARASDGIASILRHRSLIWNFAQRDLKSRYKGTAMGWAWSLIVPLSTLGMYSVVFGLIFKAPAPPFGNGHEPIFVVWLFAGFVAFGFFSNGVTTAMAALSTAGAILKKVYFPVYAPVIGSLIAVTFQSAIEASILIGVMVCIGNVSLEFLLLPLWGVLFFGFVAGVAMCCAIGSIYFRDLGQLVGVLLQVLFFATPIMYPLSMIPDEVKGIDLRQIIELNPLTGFVGMMRTIVYDLQGGSVIDWSILVCWTGVSVAIGSLVVVRYGRDLGEQV